MDIFSRMIYNENLAITQSFFSDLGPQIQGGIIEFYLIEHIKYKGIFYNTKITINNFESIETFVPNSFFIQNYSSYRNDTKNKYNEFKERKDDKKKIKFPKKNCLIKQNQFTGKYYDFSILIYSIEKKGFYLIMFQVSKKKISSQRLFKEEHEIVLTRVKENLETEFDINILEGYFCYIFTDLSNDKTTLEFCEEYQIPYLQFSFQTMEFNHDLPFVLERCFITNKFPYHNCFSILPKEKFKLTNSNNSIKINNYREIISYAKNFTFENIDDKNQKILSFLFKAENKGRFYTNNFAIYGYFDKIENFANNFCIWYDNKENLIIYYKDNNSISIKEKMNFSKDNKEKKNYILICSKYEYIYKTDKEIEKIIKDVKNKINDYISSKQ